MVAAHRSIVPQRVLAVGGKKHRAWKQHAVHPSSPSADFIFNCSKTLQPQWAHRIRTTTKNVHEHELRPPDILAALISIFFYKGLRRRMVLSLSANKANIMPFFARFLLFTKNYSAGRLVFLLNALWLICKNGRKNRRDFWKSLRLGMACISFFVLIVRSERQYFRLLLSVRFRGWLDVLRFSITSSKEPLI